MSVCPQQTGENERGTKKETNKSCTSIIKYPAWLKSEGMPGRVCYVIIGLLLFLISSAQFQSVLLTISINCDAVMLFLRYATLDIDRLRFSSIFCSIKYICSKWSAIFGRLLRFASTFFPLFFSFLFFSFLLIFWYLRKLKVLRQFTIDLRSDNPHICISYTLTIPCSPWGNLVRCWTGQLCPLGGRGRHVL